MRDTVKTGIEETEIVKKDGEDQGLGQGHGIGDADVPDQETDITDLILDRGHESAGKLLEN